MTRPADAVAPGGRHGGGGSYHGTVPAATAADLAEWLSGRRVLALSGAGLSTESGIPDYRSPARLAKPRQPMRYQTFIGSAEARQRYWARSYVGWPTVARAQPNPGHLGLARLERAGFVQGVLTQNVDGLHQAAGGRRVLELHGNLGVVRCLSCGKLEARRDLQRRLAVHNPDLSRAATEIAPDGDAELPEGLIAEFRVPGCLSCGGVLKPDVVFFGENVPRYKLERAWRMLEQAEALLVLGSSLTVYSGYRFVTRAAQEGKPVAIVNLGPTRGDAEASLKLEAPLGAVLGALAERLAGTSGV